MSSTPVMQKPATASREHPTYRDIAVVSTDMPGDVAALAMAATLARHYGAELDVIQVLAMPLPALEAWALMPDPGCIERYADLRAQAEKRSAEFRRRLQPLGVQGRVRTFEAFYDSVAGIAATAARHADLGVIARPQATAADIRSVHDYFAALLLESGRPVLLIPATAEPPAMPLRRVVVAWADTREAARAVHDALPLLEAAETVDIVMIDPVAGFLEDAANFGTTLAVHLERHGVTARVITEKSRGRFVSSVILDRASRAKAQLIVAGGYGHSRLREWIIGGTTRDLFFESPVPVFFSH